MVQKIKALFAAFFAAIVTLGGVFAGARLNQAKHDKKELKKRKEMQKNAKEAYQKAFEAAADISGGNVVDKLNGLRYKE